MLRILFLTTAVCLLLTSTAGTTMGLISTDFEVFGRVQGVFFRKYTKEQAVKLGLRGWCQNTASGTVLGHIEGSPKEVQQMVEWLTNTGSPSSRIEKTEFRNREEINEFTCQDFVIRK